MMLKPWKHGSPTVYMLVGLPGVGKSFWVTEHLQTAATPTHVAGTDIELEKIAVAQNITYDEAHRNYFKEADRAFKVGIADAARRGDDIVIDRTNMFLNARRKIMALIESNTGVVYVRRAIIFSVPDEVLKERLNERAAQTGKTVPWSVVEQMREGYVEPSSEEFHFIKRV